MIRIFTPEPLSSFETHPLLFFRFGKVAWRGVFDEDPFRNFFEYGATFVDNAADAEILVLPNNFKTLDGAARTYIKSYADEAEKLAIPIFVFAFGDLNDGVYFDQRVWVFRLSTYASTKGPQDIVVPTTAQDLGSATVVIREKKELPIVSFCGFAGFKTAKQWGGYLLKNLLWDIRALHNPIVRAHKQGIFWRRAAIRACENSSLLKTSFILRRSFSGALRTIELPPAQARREFFENVVQSDFVLAPKGDGNYSNRFLEALSLGRIPVLIDTDIVLPLEDIVDYSKIIVRVPMDRVQDTPRYIREFYDSLSEEEWATRQRMARSVFEEYLRQDSFFRYFFNHLR